MGYRALETIEHANGSLSTILTIEGQVGDVACYILAGEHEDWSYVLEHGTKMTERAARQEVTWPRRLEYRR